jgi:hypothetical protein
VTDDEARTIVELSAKCDQGQALHRVLDLLVDADLDNHILDNKLTDEEYETKTEAETALFLLATNWAATKKAREVGA